MLQIHEIQTKNQFFKIRKKWNSVLDKSLDNNIFLTWEKMAPSVTQLTEKNLLKIICASESNKLLGIAPFRKTRKSLKGILKYDIIEPLTNGDTDYTGIIFSQQAKEILHKFMSHLLSQNDWDFIVLPDLPQISPTLDLIKQNPNLLTIKIRKGSICPYISIPDTKEKLLSSLKKSFRKRVQRQLRRLEKIGKIELKQYQELGSLNQGIETLFELHQKRWASIGKPGRFKNQRERTMTKETAKYFAEKDWLRLYFLTLDNKPIAVELDLEYQGKMYFHIKGWNPAYSKYSIGHVLTLKVLEECINKEVSEYDFMQGAENYKFDWTSKFRQNFDAIYVNRKLSSRTIYFILNSWRFLYQKLKISKLMNWKNRFITSFSNRINKTTKT